MLESTALGQSAAIPGRISARCLLVRAAEIYDAPDSRLRELAPAASRRGFASGAEWMGQALRELRGLTARETVPSRPNFHWLGFLKYALATGAALAWASAVWALAMPLLVPAAILVFYAVEAQMVFLFPLALDGSTRPFRDAWRWTRRAGGTAAVMRIVLPLAGTMLGCGLVGRGFVRSWCLGCLAVCIWYEVLDESWNSGEAKNLNQRHSFQIRFRFVSLGGVPLMK
jgi:hypothetical protein